MSAARYDATRSREPHMVFELQIEVGQPGMTNGTQLGAALERVAVVLRNQQPVPLAGDGGLLEDSTGNVVGRWELVESRRLDKGESDAVWTEPRE